MARKTREKQLTLAVSIALTAGVLSIVPQVGYGAPVHDAGSSYNTGATVAQNGTVTSVTGNQTNNVVAWKDFSVGKGETVQFDGGAKTNNYLNVVTGQATSQIAGTIQGGKDVYLVNPHGVIFSKDATVNVGNLYVSTKNVDAAVNAFKGGTSGAGVITSGTANADVVNLGTIQADKVQVEGKNIRFLNSENITATGANVTLNHANDGYAHVGNTTGSDAGYAGGVDYYKLIHSADELQNINNASSKNYMLSDNIDMSGVNFTPIGNSSTPFSGKFDGMFYEIRNLSSTLNSNNNDTYAGLFGVVKGTSNQKARIDNLGLVGARITANSAQDGYAGAIAGYVSHAVLQNVYSEKGTSGQIIAGSYGGGLVGALSSGSSINTAYNTNDVSTSYVGGGIVGIITQSSQDTTKSSISLVYNKGKVTANESGGVAGTVLGTNYELSEIYDASGQKNAIFQQQDPASYISSSSLYSSDYKALSSLSTDGTTNSNWRIYEGQTTPLLTAFMQGTATADYQYNYFSTPSATQATDNGLARAGYGIGNVDADGNYAVLSGKNGGKDVTATYTAQYYRIAGKDDSTKAGNVSDVVFSSNVDTSQVSVASPMRDVSGSTSAPQQRAYLYSGQHGYNIVGGNVTITPKSVDLQNVINDSSGSLKITKEYDGTSKADASSIASLVTSSSKGIYAEDLAAGRAGVKASDDLAASYYTAYNKDAGDNRLMKDVGTGVVAITQGDLTLDTKGSSNYVVSGDSHASLVGKTFDGEITPRTLFVKLKQDSGFDKTYDGSADVLTQDGTTIAANAGAAPAQNIEIDSSKDASHQAVSTTQDGKTTIEDVKLSNSAIGIEYAAGTTEDPTARAQDAGKHDIVYTGDNVSLNSKNYQLVVENSASANVTQDGIHYDVFAAYQNGQWTKGNGTLKATGTIQKRAIDTAGFTLLNKQGETLGTASNPVTKTYDGQTAYNLPDGYHLQQAASSTLGQGVIAADRINFTPTQTANFEDASGKATSQVADATQVGYQIKAQAGNETTRLENYLWGTAADAKTLNSTDSYEIATAGKINRRNINVAVTDAGKNLNDKTYDTTQNVDRAANPGAFHFVEDGQKSNAAIDYATGSQQLVEDETNHSKPTISVSAQYDDPNVKWDHDTDSDTWTVGRQGVSYTVKLDGANAANYTLNGQDNAQSLTISGQAQGRITPASITNVQFENVEKDYNTTATVDKKQPKDQITLKGADGILGSDTAASILKIDDVTGTYGKLGNNIFTDDSHARGGEEKDVRYQGIALQNEHGNYRLDSSTAYGKGKINPLTIKDADKISLEQKKAITKVYNNSDDVATDHANDSQNEAHAASEYIGALKYTMDSGEEIPLAYDSGTAEAHYDTKNSQGGAKQNVTYRLVVKGDEYGDYTLDSSLLHDGKLEKDLGKVGVITPRTVTASIANTNTDKVYDATKDVVDANGSKVTDGSKLVTLEGLLNDAQNASTAEYKDANVAYAKDASDNYVLDENGKKQVASVGIDYTVKITGGEDATNYVVKDAEGNEANSLITGTDANFATREVTGKTGLTGNGKIMPRQITVKFADHDANGQQVTKAYNGNTTVNQTAVYTFSNLAPNGTDGTSDGTINETRLALNHFDKAYDNANVNKMDATGQLTNWVNYTNLSLTGEAADNYELTNTSARGEGTITTNKLTKANISALFGDISKTYDGSNAVGYDHSDTNTYFKDDAKGIDETGKTSAADYVKGLTLGGVSLDGTNGSPNRYEVRDGHYADAAAGRKNVSFDFHLPDEVWENFDFSDASLAGVANNTAHTLKLDTQTFGVEGGAKDGIITPKYLKATFNDGAGVTKVYNGKQDIVTNSQDNPAGTNLDISNKVNYAGLVNGEDKASVVTLTGEYSSPNVARDTEGSVTSMGVNYRVMLNDRSGNNYRILDVTDTTETGAKRVAIDVDERGASFTGTGTITPKNVKLKLKDGADLIKYYDSKANVEDADMANFEYDGLISGETKTAKQSELQANYIDDEGNPDANVAWDESAHDATWKSVKVTNAKKAFADGEGTANINNYEIADELPVDKDEQRSKILRRKISFDDVELIWENNISKEYDGTPDIENPQDHVMMFRVSKVKGDNGQDIDLDTPLDIQYDGTAKFVEADGTTDKINQGKNLGVEVSVRGIKQEELHNFEGLSENDITNHSYHNYDPESKTSTGDVVGNNGVITPRVLTVKPIAGADLDKIYNGSAEVKDAGDKFTFVHLNADGTEDSRPAIVSRDNGTVNASVTNAYYTADNSHDANAGKNKAIVYDAAITGDDTMGNYTLVKADPGAAVHEKKDIDSGLTGTIERRKVYVDFADKNDYNQKVYDGNANVTDKEDADKGIHDKIREFSLSDEELANETGIIAADKGKVKVGGVTGSYDMAHVKRDQSGKVVDGGRTVTYTGFNVLKNDNSNTADTNYEAVTSDGTGKLTGKGTITPKIVQVGLTNENVTQTYNNTTAVEDLANYGEANLTSPLDVITGDTLKVKLAEGTTPAYDNKNANVHYVNGVETQNTDESGNPVRRSVTYQITWDNPDYELAAGGTSAVSLTKKGNIKTTDGQQASGNQLGTATLTTSAAKITPRTVQISADPNKIATRLYDGESYGVAENAMDNLTATNLAKDEKLVNLFADGGTLTSAYDADPNAGKDGVAIDGDKDDLREHDVTYTYALKNGNYQLDDQGTMSGTAQGEGVIRRAMLTLTADPKSMTIGGTVPAYTGKTTGFAPRDEAAGGDKDIFEDGFFGYAPKDGVTKDADGNVTAVNQTYAPGTAGQYAVYGWYRVPTGTQATPTYQYYSEGNFGKNYYFRQAPGNAAALTVTTGRPDLPTGFDDAINADKHVIPDTAVYNNATHDAGGSVNRDANAGLEYAKGGINAGVLEENGTSAATGSAALAGDRVVNLAGGDAMSTSYTTAAPFTVTGDTDANAYAGTNDSSKDASAGLEYGDTTSKEASAGLEYGDTTSKDASAGLEYGDTTSKDASAGLEYGDMVSKDAGVGLTYGGSVSQTAETSGSSPVSGTTEQAAPVDTTRTNDKLTMTSDALLFGDNAPATASETAEAGAANPSSATLFGDTASGNTADTEGGNAATHPAAGGTEGATLFDDHAQEDTTPQEESGNAQDTSAISVTTADEDADDGEESTDESGQTTAARGSQSIGIESEADGVNLAG